jgi:hypothetical protein
VKKRWVAIGGVALLLAGAIVGFDIAAARA